MGKDRDKRNHDEGMATTNNGHYHKDDGKQKTEVDRRATLGAFYGREPFDWKLTVLRLFRNLWWVAAVTLAGTVVFGGGYFVKCVLLGPQPQYRAVSRYYVEYAVEEEKDVSIVHINETSWNTYVATGEFLDAVSLYLPEGTGMTRDGLRACLGAILASDLRVVSTTVTTDTPGQSLAIAGAVEEAMTKEFPKGIREITGIRLIDPAIGVEEVRLDVRPVRAFVLSAVLFLFFGLVVFLLRETGEDSIWLPALVEKRYGLKTVGTLEDPGLAENMSYLFGGKAQVALCAVQSSIDSTQVLDALREKAAIGQGTDQADSFQVVAAPISHPESAGSLRQADGILLVLKAGPHAGGQLEYVKEYLERQDCPITAVLLWQADEWLIRRYYWLPDCLCHTRKNRANPRKISGNRPASSGQQDREK